MTIYLFLVLRGTHTVEDAGGIRRYRPGDVLRSRINLIEAFSQPEPGRELFQLVGVETNGKKLLRLSERVVE